MGIKAPFNFSETVNDHFKGQSNCHKFLNTKPTEYQTLISFSQIVKVWNVKDRRHKAAKQWASANLNLADFLFEAIIHIAELINKLYPLVQVSGGQCFPPNRTTLTKDFVPHLWTEFTESIGKTKIWLIKIYFKTVSVR